MAAIVPYIPQIIGAVGGAVSARNARKSGTPSTVVDTSTPMDEYIRRNSGEILNHYISNPDQIRTYQGPFAAPLTGGENRNLSMLEDFLSGSGASSVTGSMRAINNLVSGERRNPLLNNPRLANAGMGLAGDILEGRTASPETDALLQDAIRTAQRPIQEQFADQLAGARSAFARAGQQVGGTRASSPFELANARLQTGLANALGDVGTNMSFANLARQQDRQDNILGMQGSALETDLNRQLAAANSVVPNAAGVVGTLGEAMRQMALPRLIEQAGIEGGIGEFQRQQNLFNNLLLNAFSGSAGQSVTLPGSAGSPGYLGPALSAFGAAMAGAR